MAGEAIRKIIHVDMDAFYASVEQRNNPKLRGKPVVVGGRPDSRGVVSTCSYEARVFGIRSAMPTSEAYRRCPHAIFITDADFTEYRRASRQIHEIFREVTDRIEPLSLDEAYLDVTTNFLAEESATRLAERIRRRIYEETQLTASAGVSYNKALAKIASDWNKPDGLTVIRPDQAQDFLTDLPVSQFWGVGPVTATKMAELGIHTGGDLRSWPLWKLSSVFGKAGPWYYRLCRGIDNREVVTERIRKSLGKERTFGEDVSDSDRLAGFMENLSKDIWDELSEKGLEGRTVTVKVKYADFRQITRSRTLDRPISSADGLCSCALRLMEGTDAGRIPVRLLGASVSSFHGSEDDSAGQLTLDL